MSVSRGSEKRYYRFGADLRGAMSREVVNRRSLQLDSTSISVPIGQEWPLGYLNLEAPPWRFPPYREKPKLVWNPRKGVFRDIDNFDGIFIISASAKHVFNSVDPEAFDYRECESVLPNGDPGPPAWLCHVTRAFLGAIDLTRSSGVKVKRGMRGEYYSVSSEKAKLTFRPGVIQASHIFRNRGKHLRYRVRRCVQSRL